MNTTDRTYTVTLTEHARQAAMVAIVDDLERMKEALERCQSGPRRHVLRNGVGWLSDALEALQQASPDQPAHRDDAWEWTLA